VTSPTIRAVRAYLARGWAPTPVAARGKRALLDRWTTRRLGRGELELFADRNVGLLLGSPSAGLVDVDCDWPEASELAPELLPPTALVHGRASSPGSHWWYRSPVTSGALRTRQALRSRKPTVVELRSTGLMTVVPPSVHPSAELLRWERWGEPAPVPPGELRLAVARLALGAVLRHLGRSRGDVVALVRRPAVEVAAVLEQELDSLVPVRAWLGLEERLPRRGGGSSSSGGELVLGRASPLTEAVLLRVGGVVGAARLVGVALREGRQACPFHGGASGRSLQVTRHAWRCWSGCGQGNSVHFVARALSVDYREARAWLADELGLRSWRHPSPARR